MQMSIGIVCIVHCLACGWYALGQTALQRGEPSWLQTEVLLDSMSDQYMQCVHWVVTQLGASSTDLIARNGTEFLYTVFTALFCFLVLGATISSLFTTLTLLQSMKKDRSRLTADMQQFFTRHKVPLPLCTRVLKFLDAAHLRVDMFAVNETAIQLLSNSLKNELQESSYERFVDRVPFFAYLHVAQPAFYRELCAVLAPVAYAEDEVVFKRAERGDELIITVKGEFELVDLRLHAPAIKHTYCEPTVFCELALLTTWTHTSTLTSKVWGDGLTLSRFNFSQVAESSTCGFDPAKLITRYAEKALELVRPVAQLNDGHRSHVAALPKGMLHCPLDCIHPQLPLLAVKELEGVQDYTFLLEVAEHAGEPASEEEFALRCDELELGERLPGQLAQLFPELSEQGLFVACEAEPERKRVLATISSMLCLYKGDYAELTSKQAPASRLSEAQWDQLQQFTRWAGLGPETLQASIVYAILRGLGKLSQLKGLVEAEHRTGPDSVVEAMLAEEPDIFRSVQALSFNMRDLVRDTLYLGAKFNFGQLIQGESAPRSVQILQEELHSGLSDLDWHERLKFFLFNVVGMMCGVVGHVSTRGSVFLTAPNARNVLAGVKAMQTLEGHADAAYWYLVASRAELFGLKADRLSAGELVQLRFYQLHRAQSVEDLKPIKAAWNQLTKGNQQRLTAMLSADGIVHEAILFSFLPQFLVNAKANPEVGLYRAYMALLDILRMPDIQELGQRYAEVSLQELASFTSDVRLSAVFETCIEDATLSRSTVGAARVVLSARCMRRVGATRLLEEERLKQLTRVQTQMLERLVQASDEGTSQKVDEGVSRREPGRITLDLAKQQLKMVGSSASQQSAMVDTSLIARM